MDRRRSERLRALEEAVGAQLAELRVDARDLQQAARAGSSLGRIKTAEEYSRDRELSLQAILKVPEGKPLSVQYEALHRECELSTKASHTPGSLPLLLHQFFCDRVSQLVLLKHMLLVRWARFAVGRPKITENLHTEFQERMEHLMLEYNDALNRARRLAKSCDLHVTGKAPPTSLVSVEDVLIYLRWMVFHQHTIKNTAAFLLSIRWFPMHYYNELGKSPVPTQPKRQVLLTVPQAKWISASKSILTASRLSHPSQVSESSAPSPFTTLRGVAPDHVTSHVTMASTLCGGVAGGKKEGSTSGSLPRHTTDLNQLRDLLQELMMAYSIGGSSTLRSTSEQLQLYYQAMRVFKTAFQQQEQATTYHTYDRPPETERGRKQAKSKLTFRKPALWTSFIKIRPEPDPLQIEEMVKMKQSISDIDPLLSLCSHCSYLHSVQRVLYALRQHCVAVRYPSTLTPLSVTSHKTSHDTMLIWKAIYSGLDSRNPRSLDETGGSSEVGFANEEVGMTTEGGEPFNEDSNVGVPDAIKLIHNEGGRKVSSEAHSAPKDAYFAFLLLRHLRIRDKRNKCLGILNYLRSVERTLTINCEGLSLESPEQQDSAHRGGLLSHRHLFNTPADFLLSESEFMQYSEVENHDDFYFFTGEGGVRVWDGRGVGIMYDVALEDLRRLERELLVVGSHYIQQEGGERGKCSEDLASLSHQQVDRFAVLLDLWTAEAQFLEAKMKVLNCYLEAYHHVCDRREKERLAQVMVSLMAARPRHTSEAPYFSITYERETQCLCTHYQLVQSIANHQITEERAYNQQICGGGGSRDATGSFGLPYPLIPKQLVSLSGDRQLLIHSHLLEVSGSLCIVASLPAAIQWALSEAVHQHSPPSPLDVISLHCRLLEVVAEEWEKRTEVGASYTSEVQKHLFADMCAEDPHFLCEVLVALGNQKVGGDQEQLGAKEQKQQKLQAWADMLQALSLRHHLLLVCSESEMLTQLYKHQLTALDMEECHAHLRCVPFDPTMRLPGDKSLAYFIQQAQESQSDTRLDRFVPGRLHLAVQELDEKHMGRFSFHSREGLMKLLTGRNGLENLKVTLQSQVAHRNSLLMACQQNFVIQSHTTSQQVKEGSQLLDDARSQVSSAPSQYQAPPITITASQVANTLVLSRKLKKAFVSIQEEKTPVRDHMLAQFASQPSSVLRGQEEQEKVKCSLVSGYCFNLMKAMGHCSLRAQIMRYYESLLKWLEDFPATKDAYFLVGKMVDEENSSNGRKSSLSVGKDPRQYRARPPTLLSEDGTTLRNLWYIPHFTEILTMFATLSIEDCQTALTAVLRLSSSLHTILQYLGAYVRLGSSDARGGSRNFGGNWGGTEGIGAEIHQLQSDISRLSDPTDPTKVCEYLSLRCRVLYLEREMVVRHCLRRSLLLSGNTTAVEVVDSVSSPAIRKLSNTPTPHLSHPLLCTIPTPLDQSHDLLEKARDLFPWQHFLSMQGPYPGSLDHCWEAGGYVCVTLASLGQLERTIANGEILGMSLLLEDVVQTSDLATSARQSTSPRLPSHTHPSALTLTHTLTPKIPSTHLSRLSVPIEAHRPISPSQVSVLSHLSRSSVSRRPSAKYRPLSSTPTPLIIFEVPPLEGAKLMEDFLLKSSQLETLKSEWGLRALGLHAIVTQRHCKLLEDVYRDKVLSAARKTVVKQQSRDLARMQMESDTMDDTLSMATFLTETSTAAVTEAPSEEDLEQIADSLPEMKLREAQISRLLELLEQQLLQETLRHLGHLHHLLLQERERDETTLPLDLWKNNSMKEIVGLPRSHVVEHFLSRLSSKMAEDSQAGTVTIPKAHLNECLCELTSGVLAREKECYQLYASYYEALLRSQYNQLYLKNQEIEHYQTLATANAEQTREEMLVVMGEHTHNLILEITALRTKIAKLQKLLHSQEQEVRRCVQQEYSSLVDNLFSASLALKNRFEDYRGQLYDDVTRSLYEVRQSVAENICKMREHLRLQRGGAEATVTMETSLKGEGSKDIQEENAQLNKMVIQMRTLNQWNRSKSETSHEQELFFLRSEVNAAQRQYLELKMSAEQEIVSLQQQVRAMQKSLGRVERECEVLKHTLEAERQRKSASSKSSSKTQEGSAPKTEKAHDTKLSHLLHELEEKERHIKTLTVTQDRTKQQSVMERSRTERALRQIRQQVAHERNLKLDAFHQVDKLQTQANDHEIQQQASVRASLHSIHHTPRATASTSRIPSPSNKHSLGFPRTQRPKSQQGRARTPSNGEMIDLSQEILALKLI